jgi:hypothetical protein
MIARQARPRLLGPLTVHLEDLFGTLQPGFEGANVLHSLTVPELGSDCEVLAKMTGGLTTTTDESVKTLLLSVPIT